MVTEGNACGAISWYIVRISTIVQEIPTGASPLGMTIGKSVRIRLRAAVNSVHTAERRGRRSLRYDPHNAQGRPRLLPGENCGKLRKLFTFL